MNANSTPLSPRIASGTCIGHVHLKVADLERSLAFYCGVLGFELTQGHGLFDECIVENDIRTQFETPDDVYGHVYYA